MQFFRDKVILITGGSSGIGRTAALRLAGYGSKVVVAARNQHALDEVASEARKVGSEMLAVATDVTVADQCRRAVQTAIDRYGRLDILLCSAGLSLRAYFAGSDLETLERVMHVNFFGTLYMTHFALPHVKRTKGSLVAMSSLTGLRGVPSYALYGASKFAVQGLYDSLRLELKRDGVHVGIVAPGFVDTPLRHHVLNRDGRLWEHPPPTPFRIWPVEKCVDRIIHLIVRRRAQINLPARVGPLLILDRMIGNLIGNFILRRRFPPI
jgi:NAD(P)-dependent dehydrogenase (short-subunit alcohol dehydrogenase family)